MMRERKKHGVSGGGGMSIARRWHEHRSFAAKEIDVAEVTAA